MKNHYVINLLAGKTRRGEDIVDVAVQMVEEGHAQHLVYDAVYEIGTITTANRFEDALCHTLAMGCGVGDDLASWAHEHDCR